MHAVFIVVTSIELSLHYLWHRRFLGLAMQNNFWWANELCESYAIRSVVKQQLILWRKKALRGILHWCSYEEICLLLRFPILSAAVSTVTCRGRSCMQRSYWSTLKLQSICRAFMVYYLAFNIHISERRGHGHEALLSHGSWLNYHTLSRACQVIYILMHTDCCAMKYIRGIICGDNDGAYV